jgi:hypothetical protein
LVLTQRSGNGVQFNNPNAIPLEAIAYFPGLAASSLFILLRTSHQTIPNVVIETNDLRDVVGIHPQPETVGARVAAEGAGLAS